MLKESSTQSRLKKILGGAFAGSPTPLKDIPTRSGHSRKLGKSAGNPKDERAAHSKKKQHRQSD